MKKEFRCSCPTTSALDIIGDKWSLVIIKQMLFEDKKTFKDFTESEESIATNILSARLKKLEEFQIISKEKMPNNKKTNIYILTKKGIELAPAIVELTIWTYRNITEFNTEIVSDGQLEAIKKDKAGFIQNIVATYNQKNGLSPKE